MSGKGKGLTVGGSARRPQSPAATAAPALRTAAAPYGSTPPPRSPSPPPARRCWSCVSAGRRPRRRRNHGHRRGTGGPSRRWSEESRYGGTTALSARFLPSCWEERNPGRGESRAGVRVLIMRKSPASTGTQQGIGVRDAAQREKTLTSGRDHPGSLSSARSPQDIHRPRPCLAAHPN